MNTLLIGRASRTERGVALVIVLSFVVLLTTLVVAYFSRTMSERQLSNNSANQTKVDVFARGATDVIVGDLKQEIVNGSAPATVGTAPNTSLVYTPSTAANIVPMRSGNPAMSAGTDPIPNLVRRSVRNDAIASPGIPGRASAVNSTTDVSANGRYVSLARWNQHYFIPRSSTTTTTDSTPTASFTAPDWVLVTSAQGPTVLTAPSTSVVGRYAYAIYDEGGLLDMNVAGYPGTDPGTPASTGLTQAQIAQKGAIALADLTQINLTQQQVNQLVGWRNYATGKPSGSFNSPSNGFAFTAANATAWLTSFVTANTSGFLTTSLSTWNNRTDQRFLSRQQLISMQNALGISQNALQYLGTFSRELDAPTFSYPTNSTSSPPAALANDANGGPNYGENPGGLLSLRMKSAGTANDGFAWNAGDPLLARRFPLGRLALIAYNATNTSNTSDIYKYFGLCRTVASSADASLSAWIYTGSVSGGSTTIAASSIETLAQIAAETPSREPNFFELLKAAIHADSLGDVTGFPAATAASAGWVGNSDVVDALSDLQILRIGANIIDQADADSYPTVVGYTPVAGTTLYAYGVEDLPYVNAIAFRGINATWALPKYSDPGSAARALKDQIVPVLWNPHRTVNQPSGSGVPSDIQLYMVGRTRYQLLGPGSGSGADYNDSYWYPGTTLQTRFNEIGLGGFSSNVGTSGSNAGYIDIPSSQFSLFVNPSLIPSNGTITGTSASYSALPFHTDKTVFGLTLQNAVIATARAPRVTTPSTDMGTLGWDGYVSVNSTTSETRQSHHQLFPGVAGIGLNVVLRYKDFAGNWQVYSAFASNVADPNGKVNTNLDAFGIRLSSSLATASPLSGVSVPLFPLSYFPCNIVTTASDNNWNQPDPATSGRGATQIKAAAANDAYYVMKGDPRTGRFGLANSFNGLHLDDSVWQITGGAGTQSYGYTMVNWLPAANSYQMSTAGTDQTGAAGNNSGGLYYPAMWAQNNASNGPGTYYYDNGPSTVGSPVQGGQTGVVRPGDDYFTSVSGLSNTSPSSTTSTNNTYNLPNARPVVINHPFQSVGELGYVFRDMPYKSLDMCSSSSVDAALLDFFTVDPALGSMTAGKVNVNTRQAPVLASILSGGFRKGDLLPADSQVFMGPTAATTIAAKIVAATELTPLQNKAQLVTSQILTPTTSDVVDSSTAATSQISNSNYPSIKTQREAPIRALTDVVNSRTWNLCIDVVAQTGQYPPNATQLSQFQVTGERRYWLHIAIDRYTGVVIDKQLEPVL